jgi:hypothetical protein
MRPEYDERGEYEEGTEHEHGHQQYPRRPNPLPWSAWEPRTTSQFERGNDPRAR